MDVTVTSQPGQQPLLLWEAKEHIQVPHDDDDEYIRSLIRAATRTAENYTKRKFITQTVAVELNATEAFSPVYLPFGQFQSLSSFVYYDEDGNSTAINSANYYIAGTDPALLVAKDAGWEIRRAYKSHTITYVCGYGTSGEDVDDDILHALKVIVADLYGNKESAKMETRTQLNPNEVPFAAKTLLDGHVIRVY